MGYRFDVLDTYDSLAINSVSVEMFCKHLEALNYSSISIGISKNFKRASELYRYYYFNIIYHYCILLLYKRIIVYTRILTKGMLNLLNK